MGIVSGLVPQQVRPFLRRGAAGVRLGRVSSQAALVRVRGESVQAPVFIVGSGRSGTHWLGYILDAHPDVSVTIEQPSIFDWVTQMALDSSKEPSLLPRLLRRYRVEMTAAAPRIYADKSHPNIWLAEQLASAFPDARFVGIYRDPYGTVASMLKHSGVAKWHDSWNKYPVPNRFLGITEQMVPTYDSMPLASKCAIRWQAHRDELLRLDEVLGPRFCLVSYEALCVSTLPEVRRIDEFLRLGSPIPVPRVHTESLNRWKFELDPETRQQVQDIVGDR